MRHLLTLLAIALLAAGCSVDTTGEPTISTTGAVSITPFNDCTELRDYYVKGALDMVGPYGLHGSGYEGAMGDSARAESPEDNAASEGDSAGGFASGQPLASPIGEEQDSAFSGTNNQEEGVDEADRVTTDGSIIAVVIEDRLQIVDAESAVAISAVHLDDIAPGAYDAELLLNGDTLLVLSSGTVGQGSFWPEGGGEGWDSDGADDFAEDMLLSDYGYRGAARTTISRLDISDPAALDLLGATRIEGSYRSARMIGDSVHLVMQSEPSGLRFTSPRTGSLRAERDAVETNRKIIEDSTIDDWVPHLEVIDAGRSRGEVQQLSDCADVHRPGDLSGLSTVSVVTVDASTGGPGIQGVGPTATVSLVASAETVYASTDRLIVATSAWGGWATPFDDIRPDGQVSTELHSFDISDPKDTDYVASGRVKGTLVNQFALSEREGVIRVATTSQPAWTSGEDSESALLMLAEEGDELLMTGVVDGLGVTEQIKSVRYLGPDLAAIVTFRQTDPLYLVDTSNPVAPVVTGELKIPGYSAYLHPWGKDYLLGIGQEADTETGMEEGLQASLFDIRDLSDPRRVDQLTWPGGYSPVEWDHRAFTAWAKTGQFFLPAEIYDDEIWACEGVGDNDGCAGLERGDEFAGVVTGSITGDQLTEEKRLPTSGSVRDRSPAAERTLVIDNNLWTVHSEGMNRYDLDSLDGGPVLSWKSVDSSTAWSDKAKSSPTTR